MPEGLIETDICVIGAGSGGLIVAAGASQLGADTVLIERGRMGGDCLNYGCIPSKSLLAAAHVAHSMRRGGLFGIGPTVPEIDFARVQRHVREVIDEIAPNDSIERFTGLGVRVIAASARFTGPREVVAGDHRIRARRFVVATGSSPRVPPIPGLSGSPFLTNETLFDNTTRPDHLVVLGGGPVGVEMAQAHRRLGARVSLVEMADLLGADDPELVTFVRRRLQGEGVELYEGRRVVAVETAGESGIRVRSEGGEGEEVIDGSHLLVAAGRTPNIADLDLDRAGIAHTARGITVDTGLRTSNRRVYAIGDVAGPLQFTHVASYHAGIVIRRALFRLPARANGQAIPRVTYSDPELAQVGLLEPAAHAQAGAIRVLRWPFAENDRALTERQSEGLIKVIATPRGRILGAGIVGARAGELIQPWVLALDQKLKIGAMARTVVPYPTLAEVGKRAASSYYMSKLFSNRTKRLVRLLGKLG